MNALFQNKLNILLYILIPFVLLIIMVYTAINKAVLSKKEPKDIESDFNYGIEKLLRRYGVPGAAVAIIRESKVVCLKCYGFSDKRKKMAVDENTVFQAASISKSLTAWGVMKLWEKGLIDLDAPVEKYLTRWQLDGSKFDSNGITIRRILSHTAGLSIHGYAGYSPHKRLPTIEQSLSGMGIFAGKLKIIIQPGKKYKYSGGGFTLLQLLIEEITGITFEKYMEKEILKPLGMNESFYVLKEEQKRKMAKAYDVLGNEMPNYIFIEQAAAGLYTTLEDMTKFIQANLTMDNNVLSLSTRNTMFNSVTDGYGLGYATDKLSNGDKVVSHSGVNRGWRAHFAILPEKKDGIVILTNSDNGYNIIFDIMNVWIEWKTGEKLPAFAYMQVRRSLTLSIAATLIICAIIYSGVLLVNMLNGEYLAPITIGIPFVLIILALWWGAFYGKIIKGWYIAQFMPSGFSWISFAFTIWCLVIVLQNIFL